MSTVKKEMTNAINIVEHYSNKGIKNLNEASELQTQINAIRKGIEYIVEPMPEQPKQESKTPQ